MTDIPVPEDVRKLAREAHAAFASSSDTRNLGDIIAAAILSDREKRGEPVAYMYPDDYARMTETETFCTVYSVEVGSSTRGVSNVALYTAPTAPAQPADVDAVIERAAKTDEVVEYLRAMACVNFETGRRVMPRYIDDEVFNAAADELVSLRHDIATRDARIAELTERNERLEHLFDIQWKRTREAGELWRQAHPGNELVSPDLGELVKWLTDRATAAEERLKEAERVIAEIANQNIVEILNVPLWAKRTARAFLDTQETADETS